ncbi:hypothetical protein PVA45_05245 [Entomospira entomophila]|uniref:DUF6985 domain-containing protein n=1 Tax=Entomospira entomophila TaxID=2719988 RepID=A0A968KRM9_9SPIO|nr:hypothetical protein [Entomospira entomophilus]NIZ40904.1 hypothetical protein [Entomospira entomophilus]WDI35117.1 hypothetical protein PVA45_05245 [Entomospira entomophilus]
MIDHLRYNPDYPEMLIASMNCPVFRKAIDLYIAPEVTVSYAEMCVSHWQYNANTMVDELAKYTQFFSEDFCAYVGEDIDSMIEDVDYPRVTSDLFIDLRELLLRWNIPETIARGIVKQVEARIGSNKRNRNLATVKRYFIEEITLTLPKEEQPYHLTRPKLMSGRDILSYVTPLYMSITESKENIPSVYLIFDCAWDEEHGLSWLIRDGKILYVGSNIALELWQREEYYHNLEGNYVYGNILLKHEIPNLRD